MSIWVVVGIVLGTMSAVLAVLIMIRMIQLLWEVRQVFQANRLRGASPDATVERAPTVEVDLREVEAANSILEKLMDLPREPFVRDGIRIAHTIRRATLQSGDFYNMIPRGDGSVGVYLVDVEGHGLPAANEALAVHQVLSRPGAEWGTGDAREQLERADSLLASSLGSKGIAVVMNFTEVDPERMTIQHANAGMPYPLLFRVGRAQPEPLYAAGIICRGRLLAIPCRAETG